MKTLQLVGGTMLALVLLVAPAHPQTPSVAAPSLAQPLRIATRLARPDAFEENGQLVGFSADIGRELLKQLQREAVIQTYADPPAILNAIRSGQADLGIAAIALTSQREQDFDFSHPILSSELDIMVLAQERLNPLQKMIGSLFSASILQLFGIVALLMLIPVHLVWYFERNNKELISNSAYLPGIFEALWWTVLTLVGQADEMPKAPVGRIVALFWVLVSIVFITYFTAMITAEITVQELHGEIRNLGNLPGHPVALVADDESVSYLQSRDIQQIKKFAQFDPAYEALLKKEVDAIVAPQPLLLYEVAYHGKGKVRIVGAPFREQYYSIALPKDSPYRKPINRAILTLREQGTYGKIYQKWFGKIAD